MSEGVDRRSFLKSAALASAGALVALSSVDLAALDEASKQARPPFKIKPLDLVEIAKPGPWAG